LVREPSLILGGGGSCLLMVPLSLTCVDARVVVSGNGRKPMARRAPLPEPVASAKLPGKRRIAVGAGRAQELGIGLPEETDALILGECPALGAVESGHDFAS
jgi:hypothetical protein